MADFDFLASHAQSIPDKIAIICRDQSMDFATLNRRADQVAAAFMRLGCARGDRVALMAFNCVESFEIANGLRKVGLIVVPVNYRLRGSEVAYVLNDSGAAVVVAGPDHVEVVDAARPEIQGHRQFVAMGDHVPDGWLSYHKLTDDSAELPAAEFVGDGIGASMIYTSGTTGRPKGAWRPHGVSIGHLLELISIFELASSDVHLVCGPWYHSGVGLMASLEQILGATLVVQPKFEAENALDLIARHEVTTAFMAPTLLHRLVDAWERKPRLLPSLRAIYLSAAPCPYSLKVRAEAAFGKVLWDFYGATETGVNTILRPEDQLRKPGSVGTAVPGQEIRLVDDAGKEVPVGEPGELWVRNSWLAEYYNRPDATGKSLHDGFFSVGDVAYRDGDGYYYICDRRVDMIISGGVNVYPAEIEAVLYGHPAVADAAVIGVPDEQWGESVKAIVQLRAGMRATAEELIAFCGDRLAGYKKPKSIDFAGELPRDAAGKLLKRHIREPYWAGAGRTI
jgi:fatty-acyl-CoA synthase/long-chain acyl-CoA synthetase